MSATVALVLIATTVLSLILITILGLHYGSEMLSSDEHENGNDAQGGPA